MRIRVIALSVLFSTLVVGCSTSPTGRRQLELLPESQMESMGTEAYAAMKDETPTLSGGPVSEYARCVAHAITRAIPQKYARDDWEVNVFKSDQVNAFALPGGKIGVYTGLLRVATTPDQLAAVLGHEVGHVMADHSNERLSARYATTAGLTLLQLLAGSQNREKQQVLALLGIGAQVGIILPYSRAHESEADVIGLDLMARAGFDPRASVQLWQNMAKEGGDSPPEFLSTHPSNESRIEGLQQKMDRAINTYQRARAEGRDPGCDRPDRIPSA